MPDWITSSTIWLVIGAIVIALLIPSIRARIAQRRRESKATEIAHIIEGSTISVAGQLSIILMVVFGAWCFLDFMAGTTPLQKIVSVLIWIGGNLILGIAVLLGHRRVYVIRKFEDQ